MITDIDELKSKILGELESIKDSSQLENLRIKYLGRKGLIANLFEEMKSIKAAEKPIFGKKINELKQIVTKIVEEKELFFSSSRKKTEAFIDPTIPGRKKHLGSIHPLVQTVEDIKKIFLKMGFDVAEGPEIESDYYNFGALNFPDDHPARDMQDTFFISKEILLRTHTSPVQIRVMEKQKPPLRVIMPGRVYRNEAVSARSYCLFNQVEGILVDKHVTFAELKGTLVSFAKQYFGSNLKYRFRPSFFPFTEPSAEMDITCFVCGGKGCKICKYTSWLEVLGCGMIDPNVFKSVNYDPEEVTGYAFGMGIDRMALLKYNIDDIRIFYDNDIRFLKQF
ncbi:MAG TPA: phenylalanine--tRNA ligase subunit alpha [Bacteroidota bacterium]|nr:phenylalanine--tRNA ligase subunit alpha [Bacteroidota bacterium]